MLFVLETQFMKVHSIEEFDNSDLVAYEEGCRNTGYSVGYPDKCEFAPDWWTDELHIENASEAVLDRVKDAFVAKLLVTHLSVRCDYLFTLVKYASDNSGRRCCHEEELSNDVWRIESSLNDYVRPIVNSIGYTDDSDLNRDTSDWMTASILAMPVRPPFACYYSIPKRDKICVLLCSKPEPVLVTLEDTKIEDAIELVRNKLLGIYETEGCDAVYNYLQSTTTI